MKPYQVNLLTAVTVIVMGLWAYLASDSPSPTSLIPSAFGVIFLLLHSGFKKENKIIAHIIVVLTLVLFFALFRPLSGVLNNGDTLGIFRVGAMMVVALLALVIYVKSFIDARRSKSS
jgi:hypothetical protein